jgi:hypothetical protein
MLERGKERAALVRDDPYALLPRHEPLAKQIEAGSEFGNRFIRAGPLA